jgi:hypothetical protein
VRSISCAVAAICAAGGSYRYGSHLQALVINATRPLPLDPDGTACNGAYAGTGDHVTVPAGSVCTLVPGTQIAGDVTVADGGTLYATAVRIDGQLTVAGSATVCQSQVASDVKALSPGGSLELGGRSCIRRNTFSGDVTVKNDSQDTWIWGNTVAGNLTVLNAYGNTESIRDNVVHNLVVSHSGPVVVSDNHASGTMRCTANTPQHGHGNTARGKSTCPK